MVRAGCDIYRRIRDRMNLPLIETGAVVVAWSPDEAARLADVCDLARSNGILDASVICAEELREREPHLSPAARGGVVVPGEAIVDPWSAPLAYLRQALMHGAQLATGAAVHAVSRRPDGWRLVTSAGEFAAKLVVNAAGLFADDLEQLRGAPVRFTIRPRKGQFLVFDKPARSLVNSIILKVPTERTKGVLLVPTVFGNLLLGPTAEDQQNRTHAPCEEQVLRKMFSEGVAMLPGLADQTVTATYAGLRPATEHRDYVLSVDAGARWITVAGIRSTGLSSALGVGEWAAENGARLLGEMRPAPPDDDLDWPWMPSLSESLPRVYEEGGRSPIVCHCEWVTEAEVRAAVDGPVPAGTLGGLKRRTRAMMGRCQGFGCAAAVRGLAPALCRGVA
jgi:glycerol-3-phosphate dehydrogenase